MKLIVGLGNPEGSYKGTRHNIGFEAINKLAYDYNIAVKKIKHKALIGDGMIAGKKVILVKPQTYMNLSGESVREITDFYKIEPSDLIILYDDITLAVSDIKIKERGSSGGHNGVKNIILHLDTTDFLRIKIGIGEKPKDFVLSDYVLSRFSKEEEAAMIQGVTKTTEAIELILKEGSAKAMNVYNGNATKNKKD